MIEITVNGKIHKIATNTPSTITYDEICELAGYYTRHYPSIMCKSPMREKHIILPGELGPVEIGATYSVEYTGNS